MNMFNVITSITTILLSVVAIGIAIYSTRKTSKEATRQIEEMKNLTQQTIENTSKEVESIKELAKLQIEAMLTEMDMEMAQYNIQAKRSSEERDEMDNINRITQSIFRESAFKDFEAKRPQRDVQYTLEYLRELKRIKNRLEQIKSKMN